MEGGFSRRGIIDKRGSTRPTPYYLLGNTGKTAGAVGLRGGGGVSGALTTKGWAAPMVFIGVKRREGCGS